ncbi:aldehyde dehydrogenase, putative [Talaromyces stipitatus ATCC 10500]|uniref:Aldehyde dehydrogenase, putative n=1 Tax=Talaromyces stipitatus (strain ATCC 10500 / CBS 375.48 / QM 6759 / NRRL 1006) TaxID=441959 RepID=B8MJT3_TALSN|nr:aldehyde dehydrogenase, putative [Talaromyces stipitatus ATCC 10500]EED14750.1 aldehyde dehydrogenase, putative [Talaromyces stipitatus ATCC 10500]
MTMIQIKPCMGSINPSNNPLGPVIPLLLDGKEINTDVTYDVVSPTTGKTIYKSSSASVEDAKRAVESAQTAFETWSQVKPNDRRDILLRVGDILIRDKEILRKIVNQETGEVDSMFDFEFGLAIQACKSVAGLISAVRGSVPTVCDEGKSAMVLREPFGVVLSIAPWNAPYILGFRSCLGPLAMGNTVILKGSEFSPGVYYKIASILHEAGIPRGCLNTIIHRPQDAAAVTSALIESPGIRKINFTGSAHVGGIIASQAARLLKPTLMELGGKTPTIVCEDANLQEAAMGATRGSFINSGQVCMCTERIIVHAAVADQFKEIFKQTIDQVYGNLNGLQLVNGLPVTKNKKLLSDAISKGAQVVHGDPNHNAAVNTAMRPVVLEGVKEGMEIYYTESFGPTVSLFTVENDEEAIKLANDTEYGLTASVYTEDLRRALRIAKKIQAGAVHINDMSVHDESSLPHGGFKNSGYGRFNSVEGLEEWVQTKTITWKD